VAAQASRATTDGRTLIIANNVLAHDPDTMTRRGFKYPARWQGVATFEFPHVLGLIRHVEFDTIYHEHYSYCRFWRSSRAFERHGLRDYRRRAAFDAWRVLRLYVRACLCHLGE